MNKADQNLLHESSDYFSYNTNTPTVGANDDISISISINKRKVLLNKIIHCECSESG